MDYLAECSYQWHMLVARNIKSLQGPCESRVRNLEAAVMYFLIPGRLNFWFFFCRLLGRLKKKHVTRYIRDNHQKIWLTRHAITSLNIFPKQLCHNIIVPGLSLIISAVHLLCNTKYLELKHIVDMAGCYQKQILRIAVHIMTFLLKVIYNLHIERILRAWDVHICMFP